MASTAVVRAGVKVIIVKKDIEYYQKTQKTSFLGETVDFKKNSVENIRNFADRISSRQLHAPFGFVAILF